MNQSQREWKRGKLPLVYISSRLIIPPHVSERDSLDMGVMVIMVIYDSFLQLLPLYHMGCVCFFLRESRWVALHNSLKWEKASLWFGPTVRLFAHSKQVFVCALALACTIKAAFSRLIVHSSVCPILTCVCVDALCVCLLIVCVCLPLQGGAWGPRGVDGRRVGWVGVWTSSPRKLSVLQKPELQPVKTMRGTRETLAHGG